MPPSSGSLRNRVTSRRRLPTSQKRVACSATIRKLRSKKASGCLWNGFGKQSAVGSRQKAGAVGQANCGAVAGALPTLQLLSHELNEPLDCPAEPPRPFSTVTHRFVLQCHTRRRPAGESPQWPPAQIQSTSNFRARCRSTLTRSCTRSRRPTGGSSAVAAF